MKSNGRWALLLIAGLVAAGCGRPAEVQIGAIVAMQGSAAPYGESIWRGIQVAQEKVNSSGGVTIAETSAPVPLNIVMRDSRSEPSVGLQASEELIGMGIPAVIGAVSSDVTLAIADLFQQSQVVLLSPSTSSPALSAKGNYIYRNFPSDELEAVNTANHIYNVAGIRMVDVVSSQSQFGLGIRRAFIERFRMLGGRVNATPSFPADAEDLSSVVAELAGTGSGGIYIAGYSTETARAARAIREAGIMVPLFGTGAILPNELIAVGGDAVDGLVYPTPAFDPDSDDQAVREFIERYRNMFGEGYDVYAAHGYDAVLILVQAIEQEGYSPDNISFYLNAMNPFPGAAGETTFDEDGNARKFHRMFVIRNGAAVPFVALAAGDSGQ